MGKIKKKRKKDKKAEMGLGDAAHGKKMKKEEERERERERKRLQRNVLSELVLEEEMGQISSPVLTTLFSSRKDLSHSASGET